MRTRRNAVVLAVSLAAHAALLAAWLFTAPRPLFVEPPTMQVSLIAPPPRPAPHETPIPPRHAPVRVLSRPAADAREPLPVLQPPEPAPQTAPSPEIAPQWRVKPQPPLVLKGPRSGFRPPPCKSSEDHSNSQAPPCPRMSAEEQAGRYDARRDSKAGGFAAEGDRKLRLKSYRESPRTDDYPGLRCTLFHRC